MIISAKLTFRFPVSLLAYCQYYYVLLRSYISVCCRPAVQRHIISFPSSKFTSRFPVSLILMALGCRPQLEQSVPRHLIDFPEEKHKNIRIWEHPAPRRVAEQAANSVQCTYTSCLILDVISSRKSPHGKAEEDQLICPTFFRTFR